ncbi:hypothetical protein SALCHL_006587 (plasmid) [Streptomyces albus subsp. chlorinus]|nr:hypothetical protein [Streptomyces albus]
MSKKSHPGDGGGHGLGSKGYTFGEPLRGVRGLAARVVRVIGLSITK